jgi:hypothetical protein
MTAPCAPGALLSPSFGFVTQGPHTPSWAMAMLMVVNLCLSACIPTTPPPTRRLPAVSGLAFAPLALATDLTCRARGHAVPACCSRQDCDMCRGERMGWLAGAGGYTAAVPNARVGAVSHCGARLPQTLLRMSGTGRRSADSDGESNGVVVCARVLRVGARAVCARVLASLCMHHACLHAGKSTYVRASRRGWRLRRSHAALPP